MQKALVANEPVVTFRQSKRKAKRQNKCKPTRLAHNSNGGGKGAEGGTGASFMSTSGDSPNSSWRDVSALRRLSASDSGGDTAALKSVTACAQTRLRLQKTALPQQSMATGCFAVRYWCKCVITADSDKIANLTRQQ